MCWHCGSPVAETEPFGRSLLCSVCGKDLRSCRNCKFYLAGARGDCSETSAEPVTDKERANFCGWFSLNPRFTTATEGERKSRDAAASAKSAFNDLFK